MQIKPFLSTIPWFLAAVAAYPFLLLKSLAYRKNKNKFLVIPQARIGDYVTQTPVFREIKKACPGSFLSVLLINPDLYELARTDPNIDEIILLKDYNKPALIVKLIKTNYFYSLNLSVQTWVDFICIFSLIPARVSFMSKKHGILQDILKNIFSVKGKIKEDSCYSSKFYIEMLEEFGIYSTDYGRKLYISENNIQEIDGILNEYKGFNKIIGISATCGVKFKTWPEEYFAKLSDMLIDKYKAAVIFVGSKDDTVVIKRIMSLMSNKAFDLSGLLTLGQLSALSAKIDLLIAVDTGIIYITCASGGRVIDIAGPVDILEQFKPDTKCRYVQLDLPCVPCSFIDNLTDAQNRSCKLGNRKCIIDLTPDIVFNKAVEML
jgi:ADP-heptose:LPS heptosyltransferase